MLTLEGLKAGQTICPSAAVWSTLAGGGSAVEATDPDAIRSDADLCRSSFP